MNWIFLIPVLFTVAMGVGLWSAWRGRDYTPAEKSKIRTTLLWLAPVVLGSQILLALVLVWFISGGE